MKILKRGLLAGALATASFGLLAGSAQATLRPDPYTLTSADRGTLVTRTALGTSTCNIGNLAGTVRGTALGASATITGLSITCAGGSVITRATALVSAANPIIATLNANLTVSVTNVRVLVATSIGGLCLYSGSLSGTWTSPTSTISARNSAFPLSSSLPGSFFCTSTADVTLNVTLAGAQIINPNLP